MAGETGLLGVEDILRDAGVGPSSNASKVNPSANLAGVDDILNAAGVSPEKKKNSPSLGGESPSPVFPGSNLIPSSAYEEAVLKTKTAKNVLGTSHVGNVNPLAIRPINPGSDASEQVHAENQLKADIANDIVNSKEFKKQVSDYSDLQKSVNTFKYNTTPNPTGQPVAFTPNPNESKDDAALGEYVIDKVNSEQTNFASGSDATPYRTVLGRLGAPGRTADNVLSGFITGLGKYAAIPAAGVIRSLQGSAEALTNVINDIAPEFDPTGATLAKGVDNVNNQEDWFYNFVHDIDRLSVSWGDEGIAKSTGDLMAMIAAMEAGTELNMPKDLGLFMGGTASAHEYGIQLGAENEDPAAIVKAFGEGLASGKILEGLGYTSGAIQENLTKQLAEGFKYSSIARPDGSIMKPYLGPEFMGTSAGIAANTIGFVESAQIQGDLAGAPRSSEEDEKNAIMGGIIGIPAISKMLFGRATNTYFNAGRLALFAERRITPEQASSWRDIAIKMREEADGIGDQDVKTKKLSSAAMFDALADYSMIENIVVDHHAVIKNHIKSLEIPEAQKAEMIKKVDASVAMKEPGYRSAKILTEKIEVLKRDIADVNGNTEYSPEIKQAKTARMQAEMDLLKQDLTKMYSGPAKPAAEPAQPKETKRSSPKNAEEYNKAMQEVVGYTPEAAEAHTALSEMAAKQWAKETGKTPDEWYSTKIKEIKNEAAHIEDMIARGEVKTPEEARAKLSQEGTVAKRGAISFDAERKAIITAFEGADTSTMAHEALGHTYFEQRLNDHADGNNKVATGVLESVLDSFNKGKKAKVSIDDLMDKKSSAYRDVHEFFAGGFERWLQEGQKVADPKLQTVFDNFKNWLLDIYGALKGRKLSPGMNELYKQMLGVEPTPEAVAEAIKNTESSVKPVTPKKNETESKTSPETSTKTGSEASPEKDGKEKLLEKTPAEPAPKPAQAVEPWQKTRSQVIEEEVSKAETRIAKAKEVLSGKNIGAFAKKTLNNEIESDLKLIDDLNSPEPTNPVLAAHEKSVTDAVKKGEKVPKEVISDLPSATKTDKSDQNTGKKKVIASVKGTDIKLDLPAEVAGKLPHKVFGTEEKARDYVQRAKEAYIRNNPEVGPELNQDAIDMKARAEKIKEEEKDKIHTSPTGSEHTSPHETYAKATESKGFDSGKNVWIRNDKGETNEDRVLMVQISNPVINPVREGRIDRYLDKLYETRPGYDRPEDFFEIPLWTTAGKQNLGDKGDMYVIRDMEEGKKFIGTSGYKGIALSALDVNKDFIKELAAANPNTKFLVGGYIDPEFFKEMKNVEWATDFTSISKLSGKPYKPGFSYDLFKDTKTMPRLKMSEGCRNKCAFCSIPKNIIEVPKEVIDQQVNDILQLDAKLGYVDDKTFGEATNWKYLKDVYERIKAVKDDFIGFVIQTTAPQVMRLPAADLKAAGVKYVELGIETFNDPLLKALHKPTTEKTSQKATDHLRENGISLIPNIIVGLRVKDANGKWLEENEKTYGKTMDYLEANKDIISHLNVYNLSLYEGTELNSDINSQAAIDRNELVIGKTFHENKNVHEKAFDDFVAFGEKALENTPFDEGQMLFQSKKATMKAERAQVSATIKDRIGKLEEDFFGSRTLESSQVKPSGGPVRRSVNYISGFPVRLQNESWGKLVDKFGDKVAKVAGKLISSKSSVIRTTTRLYDGLVANVAKSTDAIIKGDAFGGNQDKAREDAKRIINNLYDSLMHDPKSLQRIDRVLDPEFYSKKTLDEYTQYLEDNMSANDFKDLDPVDIQNMYDDLKSSAGWDQPGYQDVVEGDLLPNELAVYKTLREMFDLIHDTNYVIEKLDKDEYDKYKGKYSARFYKKYEVPEDIAAEVSNFTNKMELGMYKRRGLVDDWRMQHKLQDPVYAAGKRFAQTMSNMAIYDYAKWVHDNMPEVLAKRDANGNLPKGFTAMGAGYGALSNKGLRTDMAEAFKGVLFVNEYWNAAYKAFKGYSNWTPRMVLKKGVTVYRPDVNLGNMTGNMIFASFLGINPARYLGNLRYSIKQQSSYGDMYRFLLKKGVLNPGGTLEELKGSSTVIENLMYGKSDPSFVAKVLRDADAGITGFYQNVDQWAKIAAYKSLVDMGVDPDIAANRVADGFQNFRRVGRAYDIVSKTPAIGPPFAKFSGDLLRIATSAVKRNPLNMAAFIATLQAAQYYSSKWSGESDDDRRIRTNRRGIPKIPLPGLLGGSVSLEFKVGDKAVNVARFISPLYGYTLTEDNDYTGMLMRIAPTFVEFKDGVADWNKILAKDILLGPIINLVSDADFMAMPIHDPRTDDYHKRSSLPWEYRMANDLRFMARGYIPGYGQMIDDLYEVSQTGMDKYGRKKTPGMVLARYLGWNAQVFDEAKYQKIVEGSIKNDVREITYTIADMRRIKKILEGKVTGETMTNEEYTIRFGELLRKQVIAIEKAKEKISKNIVRVPKKKVADIIDDLNYQQELEKMLGLPSGESGAKEELLPGAAGGSNIGAKEEKLPGAK